jgi:nucleoside-diphosphate-sugar epimerase
MKLNMDRALVTGGAGFIGSHLAEALVSEGVDVAILDNLSTGNPENLDLIRDRITFYEGDIRDRDLLENAAENADVIFHLAAIASVPQSVEHPVESAMVNDIGTLHVLEAARRNHAKRVVLSSSCAVYGDDLQLPKVETMAPKPLSPYAFQKMTGEGYARLYHDLYRLESVCLRYFNVFGPRQDPSSPYSGVISLFMTQAAAKRPPMIYGDGQQYRDFIFVKDVVAANLLASQAADAGGRAFNVGTGSFVRIGDLWEQVCRLAGLDIRPCFAPPRPGDILESVADIGRIRSELGFSPEYAFEEGLRLTSEWYRDSIQGRKRS